MILVLAKAVACWLHSLSGKQHDTAFCTLHAHVSVLRSWRFVIEPEQGFFESGVYVRFLRSRSGQKTVATAMVLSPFALYLAGSEP